MKFNKFEVFNSEKKRMAIYKTELTLPNKEEVNAMLKGGYKIKIDGIYATKKTLSEIIK